MLFKNNSDNGQYRELSKLYDDSVTCVANLKTNYPEYNHLWTIVLEKMQIIKKTIDADMVPSEKDKRSADISTMLSHELRDFPNDNDLLPLFKLDKAFTLLGMKDIRFENSKQPT